MEASPSSGLLKRAKTPSSTMAHVTSCLVDGCDSDLSLGREYHRRHKVCEFHSKAPKVTIRGLEQRFCQQCSRFHCLLEFDEGKRSCRKRLDGHNRRRRKPQSESQSHNTGTGGFYPNQQGGTFLSFSGNSQLLPSDLTWPADQCFNYVDRHESFPGQAAVYNYGEGNQFKIMHGNEAEASEYSSLCQQPLLDANNSDCALSLLSPAPAETRESALSRMQAPYTSIHFCDPSQFSQGMELESKPPVSALSSFIGYSANIHFQGMSQNLPDGPSSATGSHQTRSFRWE